MLDDKLETWGDTDTLKFYLPGHLLSSEAMQTAVELGVNTEEADEISCSFLELRKHTCQGGELSTAHDQSFP